MDIDYQLVETTFTLTRAVDVVIDDDHPEGLRTAANTTVVQGVRGDDSDQRELRFGSGSADDDFSVELTPDQRLASLSFKSVGARGQVLNAAVTLAAFTVGVATRVAATGPGPVRHLDTVHPVIPARTTPHPHVPGSRTIQRLRRWNSGTGLSLRRRRRNSPRPAKQR